MNLNDTTALELNELELEAVAGGKPNEKVLVNRRLKPGTINTLNPQPLPPRTRLLARN
jgi:hypothetical protein